MNVSTTLTAIGMPSAFMDQERRDVFVEQVSKGMESGVGVRFNVLNSIIH